MLLDVRGQFERERLRDGDARPADLGLEFLGRYWTAGEMIPRMKSTSATRSPQASAIRSPANAPSRIAARRYSGMASCSAQTCSVLAR
jgi:hypothetical protein